jgi:hypothetical protein
MRGAPLALDERAPRVQRALVASEAAAAAPLDVENVSSHVFLVLALAKRAIRVEQPPVDIQQADDLVRPTTHPAGCCAWWPAWAGKSPSCGKGAYAATA